MLFRLAAERLSDLQKLHARGLVEQQVTLACCDVNMRNEQALAEETIRKLSFRRKLETLSEACTLYVKGNENTEAKRCS